MSLPTLLESVQKLQMALQAKAKAEPGYRLNSLWDKVCRDDVLWEAYRRCRLNGGAPAELRSKIYAPQPLLRVWIPKANGGQRPLGIPTIRDRVVQMALLLVIGPIFEADLCDEQYGFRPNLDAKLAIRRTYYHVTELGLCEVVDADLSDYFNTIPHGPLMRCLSRRILPCSPSAVRR